MLSQREIRSYPQTKNSPIQSTSTFDCEEPEEFQLIQWEPQWKSVDNRPERAFAFCSYCGKYVGKMVNCYVCEGENNKTYVCHNQCLDENYHFTEFLHNSFDYKSDPFLGIPQPIIGTKQYLVTIKIEHPVTPIKYLEINSKIYATQNRLILSLLKQETCMFEPNMIVLPFSQFKISLKIKDLKSQHDIYMPLNFCVDLDFSGKNYANICAKNQQICFFGGFEMVQEETTKDEIINNLNFKYEHNYKENNIILFQKFLILLDPQEHQFIQKTFSEQFQQQGEQLKEKESKKLEDQLFIEKIKTQHGSKQFQKNLKNMKPSEIQEILEKVLPYIEQIILDQYGNYMFQSLLKACNCDQRLFLIGKININLHKIISQKQGTFVLQVLISLCTSQIQFEKLGEFLWPYFFDLATDENANHFMRKFIERMPPYMLNPVVQSSCLNLIALATHKNAVCVMKSLLRALKQAEKHQKYIYQSNSFLSCLIQNAYYLIKDEFGNYLIQEAYQRYQTERLYFLSQYICQNLYEFSLQKYSSNVVIQCLKRYWRNQPDFYYYLQNFLSSKQIVQLYELKDSNKVLLEIMEMSIDYGLKDIILEAICIISYSKFNTNRWVSILGQKSNKKKQTKSRKPNA